MGDEQNSVPRRAGHPLLDVFESATRGAFPAADGGVTLLPPFANGTEAVVAFTGHAYIATGIVPERLADLDLDGMGRAMHPRVVQRLAGPTGWIGTHDVVLWANGIEAAAPIERFDLDHHPRVRHAHALREGVRVFGEDGVMVTLGRGVAGRLELGVETTDVGRGAGRSLIQSGQALVGTDQVVFAAVAPGNARALRAFLSSGFVPIGSEIIIRPERPRS